MLLELLLTPLSSLMFITKLYVMTKRYWLKSVLFIEKVADEGYKLKMIFVFTYSRA